MSRAEGRGAPGRLNHGRPTAGRQRLDDGVAVGCAGRRGHGQRADGSGRGEQGEQDEQTAALSGPADRTRAFTM